jgi:hypothetical protein
MYCDPTELIYISIEQLYLVMYKIFIYHGLPILLHLKKIIKNLFS